jgi:2-iminobutanoate/2-iminopropanoate deaminase
MRASRVIRTPELMQPIAHFSHAVRVGELVHIGATAGTDAARRLAGQTPGLVDPEAQIQQTFDNLDRVLGLLGARREHLVRIKSYVTDVRHIARYENIYGQRFGRARPAHAVVGSPGFPLPQAAVELDAIAIVGPPITFLSDGGVLAGSRHYCTAVPIGTEASDVTAQSRATLAQLSAALTRAGLAQRDVVNLHVTLRDVRDFPSFEDVFQGVFERPYPSRTVVAAPLASPRLRVQIESIAYAGGGRAIGVDDVRLGCASPAILVGEELFISGQLGIDRSGRLLKGAEQQMRSVWARAAELLTLAGMQTEQVLRTNNILNDWRDYGEFNAGYGANVSLPFPPRTTAIAGLLEPDALIQMEAIAHARASDAVVLTAMSDAETAIK